MTQKRALITGASSGIGATFARALARQGYALALTARRGDRLAALAQELSDQHGVGVDTLIADLADNAGVMALERYCSEHDIDLLINNAGFGLGKRFSDVAVEPLVDMITVHNTAAVRLCKAVLPGMRVRKNGAIINVASVAGFLPAPGSGTYSATKAFLISLSQSLSKELHAEGIRVQALCPGFTYSEFHDTPQLENFRREDYPRCMWMRAEDVVARSLQALQKNTVVCVPGFLNKVLIHAINNPITAPLMWHMIAKKKQLKT